MPAPRIVTPSTSSDNDRSNENVPAGISITSPGWASSNSSRSVVSSNGAAGSVVVGDGAVGSVVAVAVVLGAVVGVSVVVSLGSAVVSSGAAESSDVVDGGAKPRALYTNHMYKIDYFVSFYPKGGLDPCKIEGMKATVTWTDVTDTRVAGQIVSILVNK